MAAEGLTKQVPLSTYFAGIAGTMMDTPVYVFDSGVPGGSVLILGGAHPYEPASPMMAYVVIENLKVTRGRVFVIARANRSASLQGMLGNAYPPFFHVKTPWGEKQYRIGDRETSPLEQWPDPFTFVHYPVDAEPGLPGQPEPQPHVSRAARRQSHGADVVRDHAR